VVTFFEAPVLPTDDCVVVLTYTFSHEHLNENAMQRKVAAFHSEILLRLPILPPFTVTDQKLGDTMDIVCLVGDTKEVQQFRTLLESKGEHTANYSATALKTDAPPTMPMVSILATSPKVTKSMVIDSSVAPLTEPMASVPAVLPKTNTRR
jgi:hypothetical protein